MYLIIMNKKEHIYDLANCNKRIGFFVHLF